jgi:hypothetical protein
LTAPHPGPLPASGERVKRCGDPEPEAEPKAEP